MVKNRIFLAVWILAAAALHVFGNNAGTFGVLAASIVLPALSVVLAAIGGRKLSASLVLPEGARAGERLDCRIDCAGGGFFARISAVVSIKNVYTGESVRREIPLRSGGRAFSFVSDCCGLVTVELESVSLRDMLSVYRRTLKKGETGRLTAMPKPFQMDISLADDVDIQWESDEYSMERPGSDPSETFGIREYLPGDPIKQIHWKLSQKADKLMLRELGLPVVRRGLLLLETTEPRELSPSRLHASAEVFFSASLALLQLGMPHTVGWRGAAGRLELREVASPEDAETAVAQCLSKPAEVGSATVSGCFLQEFERCGYAHVAVISPDAVSDAGSLWSGNRVTAICCGDPPHQDGVRLLKFDPEHYKSELSQWEF